MEEIETIGGADAILNLIEYVREEPKLWDRSSSEFITNFDAKIYHFSLISTRLNLNDVTGETVLNAWRELSEKYRRRLYDGKRRNGTTSWPYFSAMSFLRDQYEQTKWYRPTPSARFNPSPTPNVAQLVDTILTVHAGLESEQTTGKSMEPIALDHDTQQKDGERSQTVINEANETNEYDAKFGLIGISNYHSYSETQNSNIEDSNVIANDTSRESTSSKTASEYSGPVESPCATTATATVTTVNSGGRRRPSYNSRLLRTRYDPLRSQQLQQHHPRSARSSRNSTNNLKQQQQQQADTLANTLTGLTANNTVAEFLKTARVNLPENTNLEPQFCGANMASMVNHHSQQSDDVSKWENIGRVWVDMMKAVRSPQLALAANKYIMNTLFAVLEADEHLVGTDPDKTRVRIRESAPQIEISMQQ